MVCQDQERAHLRARLRRHEERRRKPYHGRGMSDGRRRKTKGNVHINVVIDEEVSGHGTLDTVVRGYKADAGISGETSDLAVQPACIGRIWFEIEIQGKPAGIQKRYEGISGIDLGNKIVKAVADLEAKRVATVSHPLYPNALDTLPCIIGSFSAGNYPSAFPANCSAEGQHRHGARRGPRGRQTKPRGADCARGAGGPWMKLHPPKVRFVGYDAEASEIPRNHPIVETVTKNYKEMTGHDPEDQRPPGRGRYAIPQPLRQYADRHLRPRLDGGDACQR